MYDSAINYKQKMLKAANPSDMGRVSAIESSLGECYFRKGDHSKALTHFRSALEILTKLTSQKSLLAEVYDNIGRCLHEQGNYQEALLYTQKSIDITIAVNGEESLDAAVRLGNLGVIELSLGNFEKSVELHRRSQQGCLKAVG